MPTTDFSSGPAIIRSLSNWCGWTSFADPDRFNVYAAIEELPWIDYDYTLVATKAFSANSVADQLQSRPSTSAPGMIVLVMNGLGGEQPFFTHFSRDHVMLCRPSRAFRKSQMHM